MYLGDDNASTQIHSVGQMHHLVGMLVVGAVGGQEVSGKSLYLPLCFAVNLKLL